MSMKITHRPRWRPQATLVLMLLGMANAAAQTRPDVPPAPSAPPPAPGNPGAPPPPAQRDNLEQGFVRQQERERVLRQQQEPSPDVRLQAPAPAPDGGRLAGNEAPCFAIRQVLLDGDGADQFQWTLAAAQHDETGAADAVVGRCLGTADINLVMRRMQNAIVARGFVTTRVLAEAQDLSTGVLKLRLLPGRIRAIRFAPGSGSRATAWNALPARPGDLLNLRDTEQALENFKRVPTAEADIQIAPAEGAGAQPGQSDLVVQWRQGFPLRVSLTADDAGSRSTGKYQGGATVSADHLLGLNDLFYVSLSHQLERGGGPRGTHGVVAHYSLPYGYWLFSMTASDSGYRQSVAGLSQNYVYRGSSSNQEIKLARLVYRDATRKTTLFVRGWTRASKNFIDDTEVQVQRRRMAGWEAGVGERVALGAATLEANLQFRRGTGARGALAAPEEAFGEGTSRFALWLADASLAAPFQLAGQKLRYAGAWRTQYNRTALVPQDRFAIGGRYTVRGYDGESSLSAERGWVLRNDVGLALGATPHELYAGVDHGEVSGPTAKLLVARRLNGAFIGVRGQLLQVQYDWFIGRPLHRPARFQSAATSSGFNLNLNF